MPKSKFDSFIKRLHLPDSSNPKLEKAIRETRWMLREIDKLKTLNQNISNQSLLEAQLFELLEELEEYAEKLPEPKKGPFKKEVQSFKVQEMPTLLKQKGYVRYLTDLRTSLPDLKWIGQGWVGFHGIDDFSKTIHEMSKSLKSNGGSLNFTINLPDPTQEQRETLKSNPDYLINLYATRAFAEAAKAGAPPEKVKLTINGQQVTCKRECFRADLEGWRQTAQEVNQKLLKETITQAREKADGPQSLESHSPEISTSTWPVKKSTPLQIEEVDGSVEDPPLRPSSGSGS